MRKSLMKAKVALKIATEARVNAKRHLQSLEQQYQLAQEKQDYFITVFTHNLLKIYDQCKSISLGTAVRRDEIPKAIRQIRKRNFIELLLISVIGTKRSAAAVTVAAVAAGMAAVVYGGAAASSNVLISSPATNTSATPLTLQNESREKTGLAKAVTGVALKRGLKNSKFYAIAAAIGVFGYAWNQSGEHQFNREIAKLLFFFSDVSAERTRLYARVREIALALSHRFLLAIHALCNSQNGVECLATFFVDLATF